MAISSTYICPIRGLFSLEPPDPGGLTNACKVAADLGVKRLNLPLQEEPLSAAGRTRISYLDGVIKALDCLADIGLRTRLIAPARRILGLDWVAPYLVKATRDPKAVSVFLEGRIRRLWPYDWWRDISMFHKRLALFNEICSAVSGHEGLEGWVIMDRDLDWIRPDIETAELACKTYLAEIRERDENIPIYLGLHWSEFLNPEIALMLVDQVDGIRISGLEQSFPGSNDDEDLGAELLRAAFLNAMCLWLFGRSAETETGWSMMNGIEDPDEICEISRMLSNKGLLDISWVNLIDPESNQLDKPPWIIHHDLKRVGLLDNNLEPKDYVESWINEIKENEPGEEIFNFIDISRDEYEMDPKTHFPRLWDHFREMMI